jgi:hypothetical protein
MAIGLRSRGPLMLYIFFALLPFETTAVIPPALLGGVTFTPGWTAMAILTLKLIMLQPSLSEAFSPLWTPRRLGLLSACTIYGAVSAYVFPRLFEGQIDVFPMRSDLPVAIPLQPSPANITQTFYFVMTLFGVWSFYIAAKTHGFRRHLLNAILFGGGIAVLTGVADLVASASGRGAILAPFRTALYTYLVDVEVLGVKRVVGLCSEASSYASLCMSFATPIFFLRNSFQRPFTRNVLAPMVFAALVVMVAISTSSSGYVGLCALSVAILAFGTWQALKGRASGWQSLALVYGSAAALFAIIVFRADMLASVSKMLNAMVLHKKISQSYIDRNLWNVTAYQAFLSTHGLGAGLGSVRASSWIIAILGNIGAVGAALILAFLSVTFFSRARQGHAQDEEMATGAKAAVLPILVMSLLAGASVGFGLVPACMFGLIGAVSWRQDVERRPVRLWRRPALPALRPASRPRPQS